MLVASSGGRLIDVGGWNRGLGLQAATVGLNLLRPSPCQSIQPMVCNMLSKTFALTLGPWISRCCKNRLSSIVRHNWYFHNPDQTYLATTWKHIMLMTGTSEWFFQASRSSCVDFQVAHSVGLMTMKENNCSF